MENEKLREWNESTDVQIELEVSPFGYALLTQSLANLRDTNGMFTESARDLIDAVDEDVSVDHEKVNALLSMRPQELSKMEVRYDD